MERAIVGGIPLVQIPSADVVFRELALRNCLDEASALLLDVRRFYVRRAVKQLVVNFQIIGSCAGGDVLDHALTLTKVGT